MHWFYSRYKQVSKQVCRMNDNRLVKEVMFGVMEGERRRGRPCRDGLDEIKEWYGEEIHTLNRKAQYRGTWRTVVKTAFGTYGRRAHGAMDGLMDKKVSTSVTSYSL